MNRTVAICSCFALLLVSTVDQSTATAQSQSSANRGDTLQEATDAAVEDSSNTEIQLEEPDPETESSLQADSETTEETSVVNPFSPREVFDLSTTGRVPKLTTDQDGFSEFEQATVHSFKAVEIKGDQFYHRTIPFEEPLHERFGISHAPPVQLTKSTLVFFGKSLFLPANLLPRRYYQRECDSNEGWRETQGRQTCPQCK